MRRTEIGAGGRGGLDGGEFEFNVFFFLFFCFFDKGGGGIG